MGRLLVLSMIFFVAFACKDDKKDDPSERFILLTTPVWESDSLLLNGEDASFPGGMLEMFKGEAKFNTDGSGYFGEYTGTWSFAQNETELVILSNAIGFQLTTKIHLLSQDSLKVSTRFPNLQNPDEVLNIRMTFNSK